MTEESWTDFISNIHHYTFTQIQAESVILIWNTLSKQYPDLRKPAAGSDGHNGYYLSWCFDDFPNNHYVIEIDPEGVCELTYSNQLSHPSGSAEIICEFIINENLLQIFNDSK